MTGQQQSVNNDAVKVSSGIRTAFFWIGRLLRIFGVIALLGAIAVGVFVLGFAGDLIEEDQAVGSGLLFIAGTLTAGFAIVVIVGAVISIGTLLAITPSGKSARAVSGIGTLSEKSKKVVYGIVGIVLVAVLSVPAQKGIESYQEFQLEQQSITLVDAVRDGNKGLIKRRIKEGVDLDARDNRGMTALILAVVKYQVPTVHRLIEAGANVNATDSTGSTPLMRAMRLRTKSNSVASSDDAGQMSIVELLLENGADVNARNDEGWTALIFAARWSADPRQISYLVENGADPEATTVDGRTALHIVIALSSSTKIDALLAVGADVHARTSDGRTPLHIMAERNAVRGIEALIAAGADVDAVADNGYTPFITAAEQAAHKGGTATAAAFALLDAGADATATTADGKTALGLFQSAEMPRTSGHSKLQELVAILNEAESSQR